VIALQPAFRLPPTGAGLPPVAGIAIVAALSLAMLLALRQLRGRAGLHPELVRKLAHVGTGSLALTLPWIFDRTWPGVVVSSLAIIVLAASRSVPFMQRHLGGVVDGVSRVSLGDCYFPAAVAALFAITHGQPLLYVIPLLLLTLADAAAALVGVSYGRWHFQSPDGTKSAEGSVACFTASFLAVHVPLLLLGDTGRLETLLVALSLAILVTLLEAVGWGGLDNLFIPLGGYVLLDRLLGASVPVLAGTSAVAVALLVLALVFRRRRSLSDSALVAGILLCVICWGLGGPRWLVPPLLLFLVYPFLWPKRGQSTERPHTIVALVAVAAGGVVWLLIARIAGRPGYYFPYTLAFAAQAVAIGVSWLRDRRDRGAAIAGRDAPTGLGADAPAIVVAAAFSWAVFVGPYWALATPTPRLALQLVSGLPILLLAGLLYALFIPADRNRPTASFPWGRQALAGLAASAVGAFMLS
jgi:phytol kinase